MAVPAEVVGLGGPVEAYWAVVMTAEMEGAVRTEGLLAGAREAAVGHSPRT